MTPSADEPRPPGRPALAPVLLVNFIGTLGFSIVLPFLVFLITRFGGNALVYGLVGATYPLFQFVGAPVLGRWSDRYGRRRILLLSQAGTLASWLIFCVALILPTTELLAVNSSLLGRFSVTWPLLVVVLARALDGLTGGNISVANAYVADISTDETRNRNFGRMGVAANLGLILGPALASVLAATPWGEALPVIAATLISLVATVLIAVALPESSPCGQPSPGAAQQPVGTFGQELRDCMKAAQMSAPDTREALRQPGVATVLALNFVLLLSFSFFYTAFPAHALQNLQWSVTDTGIFFAVLSLLLVIVEGPVLGVLSRHVREAVLVIVGSAVLGTNFLLLTSNDVVLVYGAAILFALGNGLMWPSLVSVVAAVGGTRYQGVVQGLTGSAGSLASIVGLAAGGVAFGLIGTSTFIVSAALAFLCVAIAFALLSVTRKPAARSGASAT